MIKIVPIRQSDIKKIVKMIEYVSPGMSPDMLGDKSFISSPLNILHNMLPVHIKFLQECYVAVENNEPLGLISLIPDSNTKSRWRINRLVLGMNAYDIGKQLIDYVVNKYGGAGVEIFITIIDENYPEAIALFKNVCSFRMYSKINVWEYENVYADNTSIKSNFLRAAGGSDVHKLMELDTEAILPHLRATLVKTARDFKLDTKSKIINKIKGYKTSKYVLDNPEKNSIEALLSIFTINEEDFWIDITISLAYQQYYEDIMNFAIKKIKAQNENAKIYMGIKDYHQASKHMTEVLAGKNFKLCGNFQILIKDYWKPARDYKENKVPAVIFPDMTSPACNIIRFISES